MTRAERRASLACAALLAAACHHSMPALGASELSNIQRSCAESRANGSFVLHARENVGLGPRTAHGTPVVIYGASWCVACEDAANYLKLQGIPFVEKDVATDAGKAASERALHAAGLGPTASLPVIDVRGTVTIGFWPCVVDAAWVAD
jgi:glutaredoxin